MGALVWAAGKGRIFLVLGLLGGLFLPGVAAALTPWLPHMVAGLLFLSALRIGPKQAAGSLAEAGTALWITLIYQLVVPLVCVVAVVALGVAGHPMALALVLVAAASSISGAPNFSVMLGADPAPALRMLILGTALLPVTILPVFWLMPGLGDASDVALAALRLLAVIGAAVAVAFGLRLTVLKAPEPRTISAIDGASVILLAVIVVGLMSAVGPALKADLSGLGLWLAFCCAVNFGGQVLAFVAMGRRPSAIPASIIAGNRNIALFLVALPGEVTTPLLLFIGCYQIPMYLTPIVMRPLYRP